ncbi:acyltransferase [Mycobacterium alsense]|uniref:acyltransferase family protein n=1 Tax=Mycobacterium alsense TaxID=324058 RepID=UPI0007FE10AA|nr:acyltransferase [Mycobacterium alsense]
MTLHPADSVSPTEVVANRPSAKTGFRPDIEGLRAVAVVAVVLFHADVPGVDGGFVGVDVFFVISGFLITGLLWREANTSGTIRMRRFYGARARRLLPASATVGVITMIASAVLLPPLQAPLVIVDGIACALYVGNYWFIQQQVDYFAASRAGSPFQHYWSLGVEEQFYLVWPAMILGTALLIRLVRRRTRAEATSSKRPYLVVLALVAGVSFALSLAITFVAPFVAFFSLPTRAWQLGAGGLVALTAGRWRRLTPRTAALTGWGGLILILLACTQLGPATPYPGLAALLPVLGAALVIGAGCAAPSQGCGRALAVRPMRAMGRVSYSWYLWHWPVVVLAAPLLGHPLGLASRLAAVLVSGGLAALTLRFIENPLRFAAPIRRSAPVSLALGGAATAMAVAVGVALLASIPVPVGRGPAAAALSITATPPPAGSTINAYDAAVQQAFAQVQAAIAASVGIEAVPSNLSPPLANAAAEHTAVFQNGCLRNLFDAGQPECATGDTTSTTTVALLGDSHATMWSPAFQQIAAQRHWRVETLGKGACTPMDLPITDTIRRAVSNALCQQWRAQVLDRLQAEHPRLVVVSMYRGYGFGHGYTPGFTSYDPVWNDGLARLVQQLRRAGAQVLVLGPIPNLRLAAPICLSSHLDDASACSSPRSTAVNESGIAAESAATQAAGGHYADLTELFCTNRCPAIVGNTLVYFDGNHMTLEYARALAPVIGALADRALAHG